MVDEQQGCKIIKLKIMTEEFKKAYNTGRVAMYEMDLGWESNMLVFVIYGASGGGKIARGTTEALIDAIAQEKAKRPYMATIIVGDFNAEPDSLMSIKELIAEEQWTDVGRHASRWGGEDAQPTCKTNPRAKATRIDGVVANKAALVWIEGYGVKKDDMIPTHSVVMLRLKRKAAREQRTYAKALPSLKKLFSKKTKELIGDKKGKEAAAIWKEQKGLLHKCIDENLDNIEHEFKIYRENKDTSKMWSTWSKAVERGWLAYLDEGKIID